MTSSVERLESIFDQDAAFYYDTMGTFPLPKKERRLAAFSSICSSAAPPASSTSNIADNPVASSTSSLGDGSTDLWSLSSSVTQDRQQQQSSYTSSLSSSPAFRPIHGFYSAPNLAW